jgi:hypothetical protein
MITGNWKLGSKNEILAKNPAQGVTRVMFSTNRKRMKKAIGCGKVNLHTVLVLVCLFGLLFTAIGSHALAGAPVAEGFTLMHRLEIDSWYGQVWPGIHLHRRIFTVWNAIGLLPIPV